MKELKTEVIQLPALAQQKNWTDLFNLLYPKVSGVSLEEFVELKITAGTLTITRVVQ